MNVHMNVRRLVILGAGTAGLLAALTLKRKVPSVIVTVLRSPDIGVIGVGEGTNVTFPQHLHEYLGIPMERFFDLVDPTWKLGIRFLWGAREEFYYPFATEYSGRFPEVSRPNAAYVQPGDRWTGPISALMAHNKVFPRSKEGRPELHNFLAYHVENVKLVGGLETLCRENGVTIIDGKMQDAERGPGGLSALITEDGRRLEGDLFVDASGFRGELIGRVLEEPLVPYDATLFCDRAVIGGWERTREPVLPYTIAETMDAGWAWQIEHEHFINRGYVYSSRFLDDDAAAAEFLRKNPRVPADRLRTVKFSTGRRARVWVENVVAIGNASGFVEPLEATAIQVICQQARTLAQSLTECQGRPSEALRTLYNRYIAADWDDIRDFLAVHYRFNTRLDTKFWKTARAEVDLAGAAEMAAFWQEHGPSLMPQGTFTWPGSAFGMEGYFALLAGQQVPVAHPYQPTAIEKSAWVKRLANYGAGAKLGFTTEEAFAIFRKAG